MNVVALILAIVVIILFYILYRFFMMKSTELTKTASLLDSITPIDIKTSPTNTRYTYGIWIYVNSWDAGIEKTIFKRTDNIRLYFEPTAPVLKCDITMSDGTTTTPLPTTTIEITDNFPIQKWVHIVTSVDNQYLDAYLDGKLVKTSLLGGSPKIYGDKDIHICPGGGYDGYIAKVRYYSRTLNPREVYELYKEGPSKSLFGNAKLLLIPTEGINAKPISAEDVIFNSLLYGVFPKKNIFFINPSLFTTFIKCFSYSPYIVDFLFCFCNSSKYDSG